MRFRFRSGIREEPTLSPVPTGPTTRRELIFSRKVSWKASQQHMLNVPLDTVSLYTRLKFRAVVVAVIAINHFRREFVNAKTRFSFRRPAEKHLALSRFRFRPAEKQVPTVPPPPELHVLWNGTIKTRFRAVVVAVVAFNVLKRHIEGLQDTKFQAALQRALSGECDSRCIASLLSQSSQPQSLPEFYAAHNLLMLAVRDGFIPAATTYNKVLFHWFENLYLPVRQFKYMSREDLNIVRKALHEAQTVGVVQSAEAVLTGVHLANDILKEARLIQQAVVVLCRSILRVDDRVGALVKSIDSHKRVRRYSTLVGIALNLIPVAGGAIAGVVSAAADVVEGLSVKDIADYALGLGTCLVQERMGENGISIGDNVLLNGCRILSDEALENMGAQERRNLEELVHRCGYTVRSLREEFMNCVQFADGENTITVEEIQEGDESKNGSSPLNVANFSEMEVMDGPTTPSELKKLSLSKSSLLSLGTKDLANLWAAHMIEFDNGRKAEFNAIATRLHGVLKLEHITGKALMSTDVIQGSDLEALASQALEQDGDVVITMGMRSMSKDFIVCVLAHRHPVVRRRALSWV